MAEGVREGKKLGRTAVPVEKPDVCMLAVGREEVPGVAGAPELPGAPGEPGSPGAPGAPGEPFAPGAAPAIADDVARMEIWELISDAIEETALATSVVGDADDSVPVAASSDALLNISKLED